MNPVDHIRVFLWAVITLHGANLNNQYIERKGIIQCPKENEHILECCHQIR